MKLFAKNVLFLMLSAMRMQPTTFILTVIASALVFTARAMIGCRNYKPHWVRRPSAALFNLALHFIRHETLSTRETEFFGDNINLNFPAFKVCI